MSPANVLFAWAVVAFGQISYRNLYPSSVSALGEYPDNALQPLNMSVNEPESSGPDILPNSFSGTLVNAVQFWNVDMNICCAGVP